MPKKLNKTDIKPKIIKKRRGRKPKERAYGAINPIKNFLID